jgi:hypothetical protein
MSEMDASFQNDKYSAKKFIKSPSGKYPAGIKDKPYGGGGDQ